MQKITCKTCGNIDDYHVKQTGPHQTAYCNGCGTYIKHLPNDSKITIMPFGQYKGREIKTLIADSELRYLEWLVMKPDMKPKLKLAIQEHLKRS
jgi:uncharacterized protein (DUF3820 family)